MEKSRHIMGKSWTGNENIAGLSTQRYLAFVGMTCIGDSKKVMPTLDSQTFYSPQVDSETNYLKTNSELI